MLNGVLTCMSKETNYDYTAAERAKRRAARIREAGLKYRRIVMHENDTEKVRAYAKKLYEKRGISLEKD